MLRDAVKQITYTLKIVILQNRQYTLNILMKNNLDGWAKSGYLPYGGPKWLKNVDNFDVNSVSENSSIGYLLEVDIEYPDELHALHNDHPIAPEKTCNSLWHVVRLLLKSCRRIWNKKWWYKKN